MECEIENLKTVLRALVVSSPTHMDVRQLLRDYRELEGRPLALRPFGYSDPVRFLRERCADCFVIHGDPNNPSLTLIVPDSLDHIDQYVQSQKVTPRNKIKGKRRSISRKVMSPMLTQNKEMGWNTETRRLPVAHQHQQAFGQSNPSSSLVDKMGQSATPAVRQCKENVFTRECISVPNHETSFNVKTLDSPSNQPVPALMSLKIPQIHHNRSPSKANTSYSSNQSIIHSEPIKTSSPHDWNHQITKREIPAYNYSFKSKENNSELRPSNPNPPQSIAYSPNSNLNTRMAKRSIYKNKTTEDINLATEFQKSLCIMQEKVCKVQHKSTNTPETLFEASNTSSARDGDRRGARSLGEGHPTELDELNQLIMQLVKSAAADGRARGGEEGVPCTELLRLYHEHTGRVLVPREFGFSNIVSLVMAAGGHRLRVWKEPASAVWRAAPASTRPAAPAPPLSSPTVDPEDALPGVAYAADVFPADCAGLGERVPALPLEDVAPGAMLDVVVGEVYSPSHFWLLRLGDKHYGVLNKIMDDMNEYFRGDEGRERRLARGAVRVGHLCACEYDRDWHRSEIVAIIDTDTVKVRHIDYGTVEVVSVRALRPLPRRFLTLPAQAVRARLAAVRPLRPSRWSRDASLYFLELVRERQLVANVVCVDRRDAILEVFLVDTSTASDVCLSERLAAAGLARARADSALARMERHLYPRFGELESGAALSFAEIGQYLQHGLSLEYVPAYAKYAPCSTPPPDAP